MEPTTAAYLRMNELVESGKATEDELQKAQEDIDNAESEAVSQEIRDDDLSGY